jgi:hypothetical protein
MKTIYTAAIAPDEREAKLPQWAQHKLATLRRAVAEADSRAEQARMATNPAESDMLIAPFDDIPVGLGRDVEVRAVLDPQRPRDRYVDLRVRRDRDQRRYLELVGGSGLVLRLQSSYVLIVEVSR